MKNKFYIFIFVSLFVFLGTSAQTKTDVWDFGAAQLDISMYNNMLDGTIINAWYPSVTPGTSGKTLPTSFTVGILSWTGGSNDRLRTSNTALTRYDGGSSLPYTLGTDILTGYLYVNSSAATGRFFTLSLNEDDEVTIYARSQNAGGKMTFEYTADATQKDIFTLTTAPVIYKYVAKKAGNYKVYDTVDKPFYYRILRKPANYVTVSGTSDITNGAGIPAGYTITFTNSAGKVWSATPDASNNYSVQLPAGYTYSVGLGNANGYILANSDPVTVTANTTYNPVILKVTLFTVTGFITGLTPAQLSLVALKYTPAQPRIYVPKPVINTTTGEYSVQLEAANFYTISATGVNDYAILSGFIAISGDKTVNVEFVPKPVYPVTITTEGLNEVLKPRVKLIFTNRDESGYKYEFTGLDNINLRNGIYKISCSGLDSVPVQLGLTSELKIDGAPAAKHLIFKPVTFWPFDDAVITNATHAYKGLLFTGNVYNEMAKSHLIAKAKANIAVPMNPGEKLTVTYYYDAGFSIAGGDTVRTASGSTSKFESVSYIYPGTAPGYVTIGADAGTTYITDLAVMKNVPFSDVVTVGINMDYATISEALEAVRAMNRPDNQRVKIMIDPGNYEEMLVIDMDSISLINAISSPGIQMANNGVDIHPNAVRITSYYGHGYNYFSMGTNQKWNADVLRVNKENGYISYANAGSGTTNGSYWNATVVVTGAGFHAENIIFENSFNQYISRKESEDIVVEWTSGGKGTRPTDIGNTAVQNKSFVERGAAIAFTKSADKAILYKCRIIGRQDSFYGAEGARIVTYKGSLMGGTDYIFGGMTLVAYQSDLAMNTSEVNTDVSYITAAQQTSARGYLMYECTITSAQPGTETASVYLSKPGYLGRPWQGVTSEVVFFNTNIFNTNFPGSYGNSLIAPVGWLSTLGGTSDKVYEYGSVETSGENNATARANWAHMLSAPVLTDGTEITTFNFTKGNDGWDPLPMLKSKDGLTGMGTHQISAVHMYAYNRTLCVSNVKNETRITVYSVDGSTFLTRKIGSDSSIGLPAGLWIAKAESAEGLKVVKVLIK